jgi:hypothetical protein
MGGVFDFDFRAFTMYMIAVLVGANYKKLKMVLGQPKLEAFHVKESQNYNGRHWDYNQTECMFHFFFFRFSS